MQVEQEVLAAVQAILGRTDVSPSEPLMSGAHPANLLHFSPCKALMLFKCV